MKQTIELLARWAQISAMRIILVEQSRLNPVLATPINVSYLDAITLESGCGPCATDIVPCADAA